MIAFADSYRTALHCNCQACHSETTTYTCTSNNGDLPTRTIKWVDTYAEFRIHPELLSYMDIEEEFDRRAAFYWTPKVIQSVLYNNKKIKRFNRIGKRGR